MSKKENIQVSDRNEGVKSFCVNILNELIEKETSECQCIPAARGEPSIQFENLNPDRDPGKRNSGTSEIVFSSRTPDVDENEQSSDLEEGEEKKEFLCNLCELRHIASLGNFEIVREMAGVFRMQAPDKAEANCGGQQPHLTSSPLWRQILYPCANIAGMGGKARAEGGGGDSDHVKIEWQTVGGGPMLEAAEASEVVLEAAEARPILVYQVVTSVVNHERKDDKRSAWQDLGLQLGNSSDEDVANGQPSGPTCRMNSTEGRQSTRDAGPNVNETDQLGMRYASVSEERRGSEEGQMRGPIENDQPKGGFERLVTSDDEESDIPGQDRRRNAARDHRQRSSIGVQKSRSVPPPASRQLSCLNCPATEEGAAMPVEREPKTSPVAAQECWSCSRKRKEPQDVAQEIDRKFSRSSSLERNNRSVLLNSLYQLHAVTEMQEQRQPSFNQVAVSLEDDEAEEPQEQIRHIASSPEILFDCNHNNLSSIKDVEANGSCKVTNISDTVSDSDKEAEANEAKEPEERGRSNSLNFMPAYRVTGSGYSTPPLSMSMAYHRMPAALSADHRQPTALEEDNSNNSMDSESSTEDGSWVSRHLAHIIKVDLAKETLTEQITADPTTSAAWANKQFSPCSLSPLPNQQSGLEEEARNSDRYLEISRISHQSLSRRSSDGIERSRVKSLTKQLSAIRRKIEELEAEFTRTNGYRPSQIDRLSDTRLRNLVSEETRLKRSIKELRSVGESSINAARKVSLSGVPGLFGGVLSATSAQESFGGSRSAPTSRRGSLTDSETGGLLKVAANPTGPADAAMCHLEAIQGRLSNIVNRLEEDRKAKSRPSDYTVMSVEQIFEEKLEIQRLLIDYENEFGHPETVEEKGAMKEIYERYRIIKRLARRSSSARSREGIELVTIPEEEALSLTLASPAHRLDMVARHSSVTLPTATPSAHANKLGCCKLSSCVPSSRHNMDLPNFHRSAADRSGGATNSADANQMSGCLVSCANITRQSANFVAASTTNGEGCEKMIRMEDEESNSIEKAQNDHEPESTCGAETTVSYHSMSREELIKIQRKIREEKKVARRAVKEFEERFRVQTGRRVTKEDREPLEKTYRCYKTSKSKLKLITALLSKIDSKENIIS